MTPEEVNEFQQKSFIAGTIFKPNTPVSEKDLFSGRTRQITRVIDVIFQVGQHAIIFGERGVGKTSLANVLSSFVPTPNAELKILPARINCDKSDNFTTVWRKIFDEMGLVGTKPGMGFMPEQKTQSYCANDFFQEGAVAPNDVRKAIYQISSTFLPIIIIDEFDRLDESVRRLFADLIKTLSDSSLTATVVLIGVGDSVDDIIHEHQSVARALVQIPMPRMTPEEIKAIISVGLDKLGMTIDEEVKKQISLLSKGLPHYAHLISLHATRSALEVYSLNITKENLEEAITKAIEDAQQTIKTSYHNAIRSPKKINLFAEVLFACALADVNELGEFAAQDIREPMHRITGKEYANAAYAQHLNEFSEAKRGKILIKSGVKRLIRYKFSDPLMQPFIIMQGIKLGKISKESLLQV